MLPRPVEKALALFFVMTLMAVRMPVLVTLGTRVRAFRSRFSVLRMLPRGMGLRGPGLLGNAGGLIVTILSTMRHRRRRIIRRKWNIYVLLSRHRKGHGNRREQNERQSPGRFSLEYQLHGVHSLDDCCIYLFNGPSGACLTYLSRIFKGIAMRSPGGWLI